VCVDGHRVGHRDVERELDRTQPVIVGADRVGGGLGAPDDLGQREVRVVAAGHAERVPGGDAVAGDVPRGPPAFQALEAGFKPVVDRLTAPDPELRLGVVDVVTVYGLHPEIRQRPIEHRVEEPRRHGVAPGGEVVGVDQARLDELRADVRAGILRRRPLERDEPAFGGDDDRLTVDVGAVERVADHPLAPLAPVVDRGVDEVDPGVERLRDRRPVAPVAVVGGVAEVGAEPDAGDDPRAEPAEVGPREGVAEAVAVPPGAVAGRHTGGSAGGA